MKANCLNCLVEFKYSPSQSYGKYCSNKCQGIYRWQTETLNKIKSGQVTSTVSLRKYLTEVNGCACSECGVGETYNNKPITLQVDHVDGNSDNNAPSNLRLLCPNCHSQTPTWVSRNKKSAKRNTYLQKYKSGRYKNGRVA